MAKYLDNVYHNMEPWIWLIAYVIGFGFVQVLLYRYFQRDDPSPDATPGPGDRSARRLLDQPVPPSEEDENTDGVHCHHCGTFNERDQMFAYCKECARPLR